MSNKKPKNYKKDIGEWSYEKSPEGKDTGWGEITKHIWEKDKNNYIVIGRSEGMHIMKCQRGSWQINIKINSNETIECAKNEREALAIAFSKLKKLEQN
jgi:hypothetical protein